MIDELTKITSLSRKVSALEELVSNLQARIDQIEKNERIHVLRVKNGEEVSDDFIVGKCEYSDLSPEKAFQFYNDKNKNFILLDVSNKEYTPIADLPEVTQIPLKDLKEQAHLLPSKSTSILVISEDGVKSIMACKTLYELGFFNINNISGGYKYWPGFNNLQSLRTA